MRELNKKELINILKHIKSKTDNIKDLESAYELIEGVVPVKEKNYGELDLATNEDFIATARIECIYDEDIDVSKIEGEFEEYIAIVPVGNVRIRISKDNDTYEVMAIEDVQVIIDSDEEFFPVELYKL